VGENTFLGDKREWGELERDFFKIYIFWGNFGAIFLSFHLVFGNIPKMNY
jgi:hypothetical protein